MSDEEMQTIAKGFVLPNRQKKILLGFGCVQWVEAGQEYEVYDWQVPQGVVWRT